ncbi:MAG TPA: DUF4397 domain-containing protein [Puia sp.]|nr:DUF4397 domain-containing protein [Puia sp.]
MRKSGTFYQIVVLAIMIGGLVGCVKSGSSSGSTGTVVTFVSLMNLSSSSTDIYLNGTKASQTAAAPGFFDQRYEQLTPGAYDIQFKAAGSDSVQAEISSSLYDSLAFNTVILYNPAGSSTIKAVKIQDNFSTLSVSAANYRFFNMSPDVPSVDLYFSGTAMQTSRTTADNVANPSFSTFQSLTPQTYNLQVKKAGTDSVVASLSGVSFATGTASTIFLKGQAANTTNPISLNVLVATY